MLWASAFKSKIFKLDVQNAWQKCALKVKLGQTLINQGLGLVMAYGWRLFLIHGSADS